MMRFRKPKITEADPHFDLLVSFLSGELKGEARHSAKALLHAYLYGSFDISTAEAAAKLRRENSK